MNYIRYVVTKCDVRENHHTIFDLQEFRAVAEAISTPEVYAMAHYMNVWDQQAREAVDSEQSVNTSRA